MSHGGTISALQTVMRAGKEVSFHINIASVMRHANTMNKSNRWFIINNRIYQKEVLFHLIRLIRWIIQGYL